MHGVRETLRTQQRYNEKKKKNSRTPEITKATESLLPFTSVRPGFRFLQ